MNITAYRRLAALTILGLASAGAIASKYQAGYTDADPRAAIAAAEAEAGKSGKRVLIDFGGNWCGDCMALETNFHRPENEGLLNANYVLVKVNVGEDGVTQNIDLAKHYGIPLDKGVPALAIVDAKDHVIYSQANGEFEDMRKLDPASVNAFLTKWKAGPAAKSS